MKIRLAILVRLRAVDSVVSGIYVPQHVVD